MAMSNEKFDMVWDDFIDNASHKDFRHVSDVNCTTCGGDGIFTDYVDTYNGYNFVQEPVPNICPCVEENDEGVVKYWRKKI